VVVLKPIMPYKREQAEPQRRRRRRTLSRHYEFRVAMRWLWRAAWIGGLAFLYSHRDMLGVYIQELSARLPKRSIPAEVAALTLPERSSAQPPRHVEEISPEPLGVLQLRSLGPEAEKTWPRGASLTETPVVITIKEDVGAGSYVYQSPPFEFRSDTRLGPDALRDFARVFKATYLVNCLLPLDLRPAPEGSGEFFVIKIFKNIPDYLAAGGMEGSAGTYQRSRKAILVPLQSLGVKIIADRVQTDRSDSHQVLIHEATHQMMNAWLPRLPAWFSEGSAEYVAMADYMHGRFYMSQMQSQLEKYLRNRGKAGKSFEILCPFDLMNMDLADWNKALAMNSRAASINYASAAVLTYYFYHLDGKGDGSNIIAYLRDIERNRPESDAAAEHLMRGRTAAQLEGDILTAYQARGMTFTTTLGQGRRLLNRTE